MSIQTVIRRGIATLAAGAAMAAVGLGIQAAPASAGPVGSCATLNHFTLQFRTGGDDLRYNSEVIVWVQTTGGGFLELVHVWGPYGDNTSRSENVGFLSPFLTVDSCSVAGVRVQLVSHPEWYETADNWNMDGFALHGYTPSNTYKYDLSRPSANKRFTASDPIWTATD